MRLVLATIFLSILERGTFEGSEQELTLLPSDRLVIQKLGEHNSWYISCRGAQNLRWTKGRGNGPTDQTDQNSQLYPKTSFPRVNISAAPQDRVHSETSAEGLDLVFRSIRQGDEGEYICLQDGLRGAQAQVMFELLVVQPISFGDTPVTQTVKLDQPPHKISCGVSGLPFPSVSWRAKGQNIRHNNPDLSESSQTWVQSADSKYSLDGTDLVIKNMQRDDEGSYLCKAVQNVQDKGGAIKYSDFRDLVIHLRIEQSPSWLDDQMGGQFYGYVTGTANLTCQAEAEPAPTFHWLDAENQPVTDGQVVNDQYKSVLMLPVVHHKVFGAYTCIAENTHGRLEKVVMLTEGAKPGTPHITPRKIYPDGIDLFIEEPQAEMFLRIEGFQVEIKEINKTWQHAVFMKNFRLAPTSIYNLDGLEHDTFYHVRARSRNKAGLSDASNIIYLHTTGLNAYPRLGISGSQRKRLPELVLIVVMLLLPGC